MPALILDLANNKKDAGKRYERAYKADADGAAHRAGLWQLSVAQRRQGRSAEDLSANSTRPCPIIR